MNADNWKVTGSNSDGTIELIYFEGTEQECRHWCETNGFLYNTWICQKTLDICDPIDGLDGVSNITSL
jgi:hypothetical protein